MDLNDDGNNGYNTCSPNQYLNTATTEHLTVYTSNPFGMRKNNIVNQDTILRHLSRNSHNFDIKIKLPVYKAKDVSTNISKVDDIIQKYSLNKNVIINEFHANNDTIRMNDNNRSNQRAVESDIEYIHTTRSFCSDSAIEPMYVKEKAYRVEGEPFYKSSYNYNCSILNNEGETTIETELIDAVSPPSPNIKEYAEKATYCRPVVNLHHEEFIYKTLVRNSRLQRLLKRVIVSRQREKESKLWNNYINELKNRHEFQFTPENNETDYRRNHKLIDDFDNAKFMWANPYNQYQNLLEDLYESYDSAQPNRAYYGDIHRKGEVKALSRSYFNQSNPHYYPTSSHGRSNILNIEREQKKNSKKNRNPLPYKNKRGSDVIICEREFSYEGYNKSRNHFKRPLSSNYRVKNILLKTCSMQTDLTISPLINSKVNAENFVTGTIKNNIINSSYIQTDLISLSVIKGKEKKRISEIENLRDNILNSRSVQADLTSTPVMNEIKNENQSRTTKENNIMNGFMKTDINSIPIRMKENEIENSVIKRETIKENYSKVSDNVKRLRKKIYGPEDNMKQNSLAVIEKKVDNLMQTINSFIVEIKSRKLVNRKNKDTSLTSNFSKLNDNWLDKTRSDNIGLIKREQFVCSGFTDEESSASILNIGEKVDEILIEEMNKSNKIKKEINDLLDREMCHPYAFKITYDIPTKEHSTEVTASLSKTNAPGDQSIVIEEVGAPIDAVPQRQMAIAVNTDPVGVLTLLRISTDTIRRLLSYISGIDCSWYLSRLQLSGSTISNYVCNICGAAFLKPSQLTDHIKGHNLDETRDCCVCRHVLDMRRRLPGQYSCRYCGQRFIRAYCCDLHQKSCAQRIGKRHDVESSHMFLK